MKKEDFPIGFWNYVECGRLDVQRSVEDWKELGMNCAMSCDAFSVADTAYMTASLDAAAKEGLRLIVCDSRTQWKNYIGKGEAEFRNDVKAAAADFGGHEAFLAFHVGDEPDADTWPAMLAAAKIVNEYARAFVNFFPLFDEDFVARVGTDHAGYLDKIADAVRETGLETLCYDCYNQCFVHDGEMGINSYFYNLNSFRETAKRCGVKMWTTLLSVGHWCYRVPNEDDMRWQISTAVAHGAQGLLWFYVYERRLESSYRLAPFDMYYKKTETFDRLARQNKIFADHFAARLAGASLRRVFHIRTAYGNTPIYTEGCIEGLTIREKFANPLIVSEFGSPEGDFLLVVNNSQTDIERITGEYAGKHFDEWLSPGQMLVLENK